MRSIVTGSPAVSGADHERPARAAPGVDEVMGEEGVAAGFGELELDEAALAGLQRHRLGAGGLGAVQEVAALGPDGVELAADHVKAAGALRSRVQHPDPHPL